MSAGDRTRSVRLDAWYGAENSKPLTPLTLRISIAVLFFCACFVCCQKKNDTVSARLGDIIATFPLYGISNRPLPFALHVAYPQPTWTANYYNVIPGLPYEPSIGSESVRVIPSYT
jgi:hypothetical protein